MREFNDFQITNPILVKVNSNLDPFHMFLITKRKNNNFTILIKISKRYFLRTSSPWLKPMFSFDFLIEISRLRLAKELLEIEIERKRFYEKGRKKLGLFILISVVENLSV